MKILIVGVGAIGTMIGVKLSLAGEDVAFYDKYVKFSGLDLMCDGKHNHLEPVKCIPSLSYCREHFDLVILCIKSHGNEDFVQMPKAITFQTLLTIQNGLGNEEYLSKHFDRVVSGTLTLPVAKTEDYVSITNNKGGFGFASVSQSCVAVAEVFSKAGFKVRTYSDYRAMKWSKLLLNIMGNAMSAITSMPMSDIFNDRKLTFIEKSAVVEALRVMGKSGVKVVDLPSYPVKLISSFFRFAPPTLIEIAVTKSSKNMSRGDKMPSLYIDVASGSKVTEIEVMNGAIWKRAQELGIEAPANKFLYDTMRAITSGDIDSSRYQNNPQAVWDDFKGNSD